MAFCFFTVFNGFVNYKTTYLSYPLFVLVYSGLVADSDGLFFVCLLFYRVKVYLRFKVWLIFSIFDFF